jgi:integrase
MNGTVYKRCPCTKAQGRKQVKSCKKDHGTWYFTHEVPAYEGRRRIRRGGFRTKEAAEKALAESLARCAQRGVAVERDMSGRRQLLGDYLREWLDGKPDIKPATRFSYADHINRFLVPRLGHLRLEDLAVSHISAMYADLRQPRPRPEKQKRARKTAQKQARTTRNGAAPRARGALQASILAYLHEHPGEAFTGNQVAVALKAWPPPTRSALAMLADRGVAQLVSKDPSRYAAVPSGVPGPELQSPPPPAEPARPLARLSPASIQRIHATLRAALNDAVRQRLLDFNPAQLVRLESVRRPKTRYWTGPEAGAFLDAIVEDPLYALYHLAVYRGPRRGEILALHWDDLDLDAATMCISRNVVLVGGKVVEGTPKSEFSKRTIALDQPTVKVLRAHKDRQRRQRVALGKACQDRGLVFAREDGTPLHPQFVSRHLDVLIQRVGVRRLHFHELRHTAATLMFEAGADIKYVSHVLGHSDIGITAKIYAEVTMRLDLQRSAEISGTIPRKRLLPPDDEGGVLVPAA